MATTGGPGVPSVPSGSSNKHIKDAFQSYYEALVKAIINPDEIAVKLYSAKVISKETLSVTVDDSKTKYRKSIELVQAVETFLETHDSSVKSVYILSLLIEFPPLDGVVTKILRDSRRSATARTSDGESNARSTPAERRRAMILGVPERYSNEFSMLKGGFASLLRSVKQLVKKEDDLDGLREFLNYFFYKETSTRNDIQAARNIDELFDNVIVPKCTLTNCSLLRSLAVELHIPEISAKMEKFDADYVKPSKDSLRKEEFGGVINQVMLQRRSSSDDLPRTRIKLKVEWADSEATLDEFRALVREVFPGLSRWIDLDVVEGGCVSFLCSAPDHMEEVLLQMAEEQVQVAIQKKVTILEVGTTVIFDTTTSKQEFIKSKESVLGIGTAQGSRSLPSPLHSREKAITTQTEKPVAKESSVPPPTVLNQAHVKLVPSSVQVSSFEPQDLPWERLLTWSALALLLLSFLAVYYSNGEVVCNSPAHLSSSFVNSACQQSLSHWSYYPLIVFLQSCVLLLPQYLWYSYSKWHVQFFFGALQRFNRHPFTDEGECELEAFQVVAKLEDHFAKSRYLVRLYYRKMLLQLGIWTICRAGTLGMFSNHSSKFKCSTSILAAEHCSVTNNCTLEELPFINCFHSQLEHLGSVWIANCFILLIVLACIIYTFTWFFLQVGSFKNPNNFDKFYLDSHLTPRHLSFDVTLANDLGFLVEMLSQVDSSLAKVFREVKVRRYMDHELRKQAEQHRLMKLVVSNGYLKGEDGSDREDDMDSRTRHFKYGFADDIDGDLKRVYCQLFGGTNILPMSSVHKLIFQCLHYIVSPKESKCAVDITFGTTEYGSALCRAFVQAVSVCFLSQLRGHSVAPANSKQCVNHAKLALPDTIYTQQVKDINKANAAVQDLVLKNIVSDKRVDRNNRTIVSFVLVGPMEDEQNAFTANVLLDHLYRSCCFKRNCCMLTLRPLVIGSRSVSDMFHKFVPVERMFQLDMEKLEKVTSGERMIQCGPLTCVFELKLYRFKDYGIGHRLYSPPSLEDDVFEVCNEVIN